MEESQKYLQTEKQQLKEENERLEDSQKELQKEKQLLENGPTAKMLSRAGQEAGGWAAGAERWMSAGAAWLWPVGQTRTAAGWGPAVRGSGDWICGCCVLLPACVGGWEMVVRLYMQEGDIQLEAWLPPHAWWPPCVWSTEDDHRASRHYNEQLLRECGGNAQCLETVRVTFTVAWKSTTSSDPVTSRLDPPTDKTVTLGQLWNSIVPLAITSVSQFSPDQPPIISITVTKV